MNGSTRIEISLKSVLLVICVVIALIVAWKVRTVLISFLVAYILMSGFAPLVDWLEKNGVNKILAVVLTYLLAISFFALLLFSVIPPLVEEIRSFAYRLPIYLEDFNRTLGNYGLPGVTFDRIAEVLSSRQLDQALSNIFALVFNAFSLVLSFITVAVFTFYLLLDREKIKKNLFLLFPQLPQKEAYDLAHKIEARLGAWVRGEIILMLIIGLSTYVGLSLLKVDFALPLAVIAGLLELIPTIGPVVSSIPAMVIAFVQSPILAVAVGALYLLIQQLENNLIVPKVMEKAVGLHPIITIMSLLIGGTLFGVIGAVLAVPTAAMLQVIIEDRIEHRSKK